MDVGSKGADQLLKRFMQTCNRETVRERAHVDERERGSMST